ncbi:MAG: DUF6276 family protein [Halobacteriales archaeon]
MACPVCGAGTVVVAVPPALREHVPPEVAAESAEVAAVCTNCLRVSPADGAPSESPDLRRISDALPADETAALALLLAVDLLESLAANRPAIESLLATVERRGVDPMLVFERLAADPDASPPVDLRRRRRQLEQLRS